VYAYGILEQEDIAFEIDGVNGADRAYTVDSSSLSAVVTDIETVDPEQSEDNVRAHNEVLQQILQYDGGRTVVPMQFGMAFKNTQHLQTLLEDARLAFTQALEEVDGKVELGLKVLAPTGQLDNEQIQTEIDERFTELAAATTTGDSFSDRLIANRSFLVDRDNRESFNRAVGEFQEAHEDVLVQYTGPWPPYSFVDIEIGAIQR